MVFYCCVPSCRNTSNEVVMHILPLEVDRFEVWTRLITRADINYEKRASYRVCDVHFSNEMKFIASKNRTNLKGDSVPDLMLPTCNTAEVTNTLEESAEMSVDNEQPSTSSSGMKRDHAAPMIEGERQPKKQRMSSNKNMTVGHPAQKGRVNFYKIMNISRHNVTPRKKLLLGITRSLAKTAKRLFKENSDNRARIKKAHEYSMTKEFLATKLNRQSLRFLLSQIKLQVKKERGRRYSIEDKLFALSLLKHSAKAYRLLRRTFALPSRRTLLDIVKLVRYEPGVNNHIINSLKETVKKMKPLDRTCTLIFDEMAISTSLTYQEKDDFIEGFENCGEHRSKCFANHAFVFMIRGIRRKWKQPIAYYFCEHAMSKTDIVRNIKLIINILQELGLNVVATICDQATSNVAAIKDLIEETKAKYLRINKESRLCGFEVNDIEVVPLFDPPHLLKGVRNNFIDSQVTFRWKKEQQTASWNHIVQLYEMDVKDEIIICYKLTDEHIYKDKLKKMKVKHAAQVLSHSVSAGIKANVKWGQGKLLPEEAIDTADFVSFVDSLFDSFNGSMPTATHGKPLRCAISPVSPHIHFWDEAVNVLSSMKFIKKGSSVVPPTVKNWITTIKNFKYLYNKLHNLGFEYVSVRNFNQDPLENFFGNIRSHGVRNINPTCSAFVNSFKSLIITNFMSSHSPGSNCEEDENDGALFSLKQYIQTPSILENIEPLPHLEDEEEVTFPDSTNPSVGAVQIHAYVAGYVARKILKIVGPCVQCRASLTSNGEEQHSILISEKEYGRNKLLSPNTPYLKVFHRCMGVLKYLVPKYCTYSNILKILLYNLNKYVSYDFDCPQHNLFDIFIRTLTIFYLHTWTKNVNNILKGIDTRNVDDDIKILAFKMYNKGKWKKR